MTDAPTTRETADHAELARLADDPAMDFGGFGRGRVKILLSEIAALRGQYELDSAIIQTIADRATQAERQRDEAVGLLREWSARDLRTPGLGILRLQQKTDALLANQGADQ